MRISVPHRWATFSALSLIYFVVSAGAFSSLGVVLPAMVKEMGWNWQQAGMGYTILGVACGLGSFLPAMAIRRIGVRGTMVIGGLIMLAGFAVMAVTHSIAFYFAGTTLVGLAFSMVSTVPGTHVLTDIFVNRSTVLGAYFAIGGLGGVAGPLLYLLIQATSHGWRPYWWAFVAMSVASGVFAVITTPGRRDESAHVAEAPEIEGAVEVIEGQKDWTVRRALMTPQFYVIFGGYTTYLLINTTAHGFAVEHLIERHVNANAAALMLSIEALIGVVTSVVGGILGEKMSAKTLMIWCLVAVAIGMAALTEASGWGLMMVYALGVGFGFGLSFIAPTMLLLNYFGKKANLELFSIMCLLSTVAAAGPAVGGWARDNWGSFTAMFMICTAITVAMLVATIFLKPPVYAPAISPARLKEQPQ